MSHPFDEIREENKGEREQERLRSLQQQKRKAAINKFASRTSKYAHMTEQILKDFGDACWGYRYIDSLTIDNLDAVAKVKNYFISIHGDEDGNISGFSVGLVEHVSGRNSDGPLGDEPSYDILHHHVRLSPTASRRDIEEALVKVYRGQRD